MSKCVYTELVEKGNVFPQEAYEKQQLTLNTTFSQGEVLVLFKVLNAATRWKNFQYRILLNVLLAWPVSLCQKEAGYEKAFDFDTKDASGKIAMKADY